jgi:hypothetical protein
MESNLKKNKYPNGAVVYVIDYSDEDTTLPGIYRLGMTKNLKARKVLYNTHSFNNKPLAHYQEISNPVRFESCVRTMLYNYRHRDNKDFFVCSLAVIKKAFKKCSETLKSMNNVSQSGGGDNSSIIDITLTKLEKKLNVINKNITKYNKLLE